jgi:hypothetical protein
MPSIKNIFSKKNRPSKLFQNTTRKFLNRNVNKIMTSQQFNSKIKQWKKYLKQKKMDENIVKQICDNMNSTNCDEECIQSITDCPNHHKKFKVIAELYNKENLTDKIDPNEFANLKFMNLKTNDEDTFIKVMTWFDSFVNNKQKQNEGKEKIGGKRKKRKTRKTKKRIYHQKCGRY